MLLQETERSHQRSETNENTEKGKKKTRKIP